MLCFRHHIDHAALLAQDNLLFSSFILPSDKASVFTLFSSYHLNYTIQCDRNLELNFLFARQNLLKWLGLQSIKSCPTIDELLNDLKVFEMS